jgi:two-component system sensor histidine kinase TorS
VRYAGQIADLARIAAVEARSAQFTVGLPALVVASIIVGGMLWLSARRIVAMAGDDYGAPLAIGGYDEIGHMEKALTILRHRCRPSAR